MKQAKRSPLWEYFTLKNDNDAHCSTFGAVLEYNDSTTLLMYHLNSVHPTVLPGPSGSQPTITSVLAKRVCDDRRAEGITQRICNMVEKDMIPISTVDGEGFRELINFLEPGYRIPSRGTITTCIEARYNERKAELKTQLAMTNVAFTTNCWTALTTKSYITVTCHYIEQD